MVALRLEEVAQRQRHAAEQFAQQQAARGAVEERHAQLRSAACGSQPNSISTPGGQHQPEQRQRQEHLPAEPHQLVVAVAREGAAHPEEDEQAEADLQDEPDRARARRTARCRTAPASRRGTGWWSSRSSGSCWRIRRGRTARRSSRCIRRRSRRRSRSRLPAGRTASGWFPPASEMKNTTNIGNSGMQNQTCRCASTMSFRFRLPTHSSTRDHDEAHRDFVATPSAPRCASRRGRRISSCSPSPR